MVEIARTDVDHTEIACPHGLGRAHFQAKTEADRSLVEKIVDGLTHLVRPLVDSLRRIGAVRSVGDHVNPMAEWTWRNLHDPNRYRKL